MLNALDLAAIRAGAIVCLAIAAPAALIQSILADEDAGRNQSNWVLVALLAIVVAYLVGGAVAGKRAFDTPFIHGATATMAAFAIVQVIGGIGRIARGDGLSPVALVFNLLLAGSIGVVGAWFGARRATIDAGGGEPTG